MLYLKPSIFALAALLAALGSPLYAACSAARAQDHRIPPIPQFADVTQAWGLDHSYGGGDWYVVGGGAAVFDCDDDGFAEAFLAGGQGPAVFLRNEGGQAFSDQTARLPLSPAQGRRVTGAYPFDYNGDGLVDLFIMRFGQNQLLKGLGACGFANMTADVLPPREDWTTAFAALPSPDGGFARWAVGNYVRRDQPLSKTENCDTSYFLSFADPFDARAPVLTPFGEGQNHCALSLLFVDLNGDGRAELRVANDRAYYAPTGREQLWVQGADGAFALYPPDRWNAPQLWGMGLAAAALKPQEAAAGQGAEVALSVTNMAENHLQVFYGAAFEFRNEAYERGVASQIPHAGTDKRPSTAWHNQFADFNGDGLPDLLLIKGNVDTMARFAHVDPDSLLINQGDGSWREAGQAAGIATDNRGRGAGVADFNGDGCLDILVVNRNEPAQLYVQQACTHPAPFRALSVGGGHGGGGWFP